MAPALCRLLPRVLRARLPRASASHRAEHREPPGLLGGSHEVNGRSYSAAPSLARRRRLGTREKPRLGIPSADRVLSGAGSYARPPDFGEAVSG